MVNRVIILTLSLALAWLAIGLARTSPHVPHRFTCQEDEHLYPVGDYPNSKLQCVHVDTVVEDLLRSGDRSSTRED